MRKQTVKTWRIDNPVYNYSLFLRCGGTIAEANAWAKRVIGFECDVDTDDACGRTYLPDDSNDHAIWLDRKAVLQPSPTSHCTQSPTSCAASANPNSASRPKNHGRI